jgi:perosamine synthetase
MRLRRRRFPQAERAVQQSRMTIPLSRPDITQREIDAVVDVLHGSTLSIGPRLEQFETACAEVAGRRYGIGVSSGTAGLHCVMLAAGIGSGDEIITTPFSFVASANCCLFVDAKPVFVDIDPKTLNIDVDKVAAAITPRTRGIVAVETFGHPGGMIELEQLARDHSLPLIEDSCEGFGGKVGTRQIGSFGLASVFGFYPNKQITTGEGGMIVTDDEQTAAVCRALRNQGRDGMSWLAHERLGYNYRLNEISAAMGVVQVSRLEEILESRRRVAQLYIERLMTNRYLILPTLQDDEQLSWFVFVVRLNDLFSADDRDAVITELRSAGIGSANYFPPIHLQPYMRKKFDFRVGQFPVCEYVSARTLALPFFGAMTSVQVHHVCGTLEKIIESRLVGSKDRF